MAAAYLYHLYQNHPFIDGNKRVGAYSAITFLLINDWEPAFEEQELVEVELSVASGRMAKSELIALFETKCRLRQDGQGSRDAQRNPAFVVWTYRYDFASGMKRLYLRFSLLRYMLE